MLTTTYKTLEESSCRLVYRQDFGGRTFGCALYYALGFSLFFALVFISVLFGLIPLVLYLFKLPLEAWAWIQTLEAWMIQFLDIRVIIAMPLLLFLGMLQLFGYSEILTFDLSERLVVMTLKRPVGKGTRTFVSRDIRAIILDTLSESGVPASSKERYQVCLISRFQDNEEFRNQGRLMYITDAYEEAQEALEKLNYYLKFT